MKHVVFCALAACTSSSMQPALAQPQARDCEALTPYIFCDDFDAAADTATPFGWMKVEGDGNTGDATLMPLAVDGNTVFSVSDTASATPAQTVPTGISAFFPFDATKSATLELDVKLTSTNATTTGIAFLDLADTGGSDLLLEVLVAADGSLSISSEVGQAPLLTDASLITNQWATIAIHTVTNATTVTVSAEAGAVGDPLLQIMAPMTVPLHFTGPTMAQVAVGLDVEDRVPHTAQFDDIRLLMP